MTGFPDGFEECTGFEWDAGNAGKNWQRHQVSQAECEQPFFNRPVLVVLDQKHSAREPRSALLGIADDGRRLAIVFTIRTTLVRVVTARDMDRKERRVYERAKAEG